jgi:putative FmdB family regulatory protein
MPVYEFRCEFCGAVVEQIQSKFEPIAPICKCGKTMILQISSSAVVFNGNGWAKKDRRGK